MNTALFVDTIKNNFEANTPIFIDEILKLFSKCSRAQVFRYIDSAKADDSIKQYSTGVYFVPTQFSVGLSTITADQVVRKKYITNGKRIYGIYTGIKLLNAFGITTQMAGTIEIVSNNESSRGREIKINNRTFIVKKSKCKITKKNYAAYTLLELFNQMSDEDVIDKYSLDTMIDFVRKTGINLKQLFGLTQYYSTTTIKRLINSGAINEII